MIDRREDDDALARRRTGLDNHRDGVDEPVGLQRPVWLDGPAVPAFHPASHRGAKTRIIAVIAVDAVIDHLLQGFIDRRRRAKIHIGDPERNAAVR